MKRWMGGALLALTVGNASAQEVNVALPLQVKPGMLLCLERVALDDALLLALQGQVEMASEVAGCFGFAKTTPVFIMERRERDPLTYLRVRWRRPDGGQMSAWTLSDFVSNAEAVARPVAPARRRS